MVDGGRSVVQTGSTHMLFQNGQNASRLKSTDDKVIVGYSRQGLPFVIAADGYHQHCVRREVFNAVRLGIAFLMDEYIELLQQGYCPERLRKAFAEVLCNAVPFGQGAEFTFSVSAVYEVNGQLRCSGWGIGDIGMSLKRAGSGQVEPLVHGRVVRREGLEHYSKDGINFSMYQPQQRRAVIERNSSHTLAVNPGDELAGSTFLFPEQTHVAGTIERPGHTVRELALNIPAIPDDTSLFETLNRQMADIREEKIRFAEWNLTHCGLVRLSFNPLQATPEQLVFEKDGERYGAYALYENNLYYITSAGKPTRVLLTEQLKEEQKARLLSLFPEAFDLPFRTLDCTFYNYH